MNENVKYKIFVIIILVIAILSIFGIIVYQLMKENKENKEKISSEKYKRFDKELINSCSNDNNCKVNLDIDPVDNIKNVIKKTLLLEEHLIEKNNPCHECIVNHFLHCLGLLEEAILISHKNIRQYPYLDEGYKLYKELFEEWTKNKENNISNENILEKLRNFRKKLVEQYYII